MKPVRATWMALALALGMTALTNAAVMSGPSRSTSTASLDELEDARRALRSDSDKERQEALGTLAELGGPEAWELVLGALADPEPRVADEAQLLLARAPSELDGLLLGKHGLGAKRELVALRVAEALGRRASCPPTAAWSKALRHKDARVRRSLYWSLERLAPRVDAERAELAVLLEKGSARDRDELARAHAWLALAALSPAAATASFAARVHDKSAAARAACAERIELAFESEQLRVLAELATDEARIVRLRAHQAFARRRDRDGVLGLVAALETERNLRLSWHLVELLQELSGRKERRNVAAWRHWADSLSAGWTPAEASAARDYGERSVAFVGMPVLSGRVAFLVDFSGSMWQERADGRTRKQAVDVELRRVLEALPEDAEFNLVPFVEQPEPWREALEPASRKNVARALKFFGEQHSRGKGNYWDAMLLALADPAVDTLMILGDGAPSGGRRWNLQLIGPLFGHENRFRGVFVDALLIETRGRLRGYWEQLTAASGGRWTVVEL